MKWLNIFLQKVMKSDNSIKFFKKNQQHNFAMLFLSCLKDQDTGFPITEKNEEIASVVVESVICVFP